MASVITPRGENFSQWYQDVVLRAQLADYSPVKGCMVIRPNGYAIWEIIQRELNARIAQTGCRNAYFPLLIPESFLQREADHIEGFAPECAVVTHAGGKILEERLVLRPTSETIINSMFAKWIQSYRDLPLLMNQWANVVRWEMRTRLFLRTTEFLWQEGHTCHATAKEARDFALRMLHVYRDFVEEVLAVPVVMGKKSEREKFAGAQSTYCIESLMQDGKALQAGTSHDLGTNFAKAFQTQYLNAQGEMHLVHQTSWGVSTRLIGGLIMVHSDDRGLVLPPRLAHLHVVLIPILPRSLSAEKRQALKRCAQELLVRLHEVAQAQLPYTLRTRLDDDEEHQVGWKFNEYELIGTPVRLELGPKDLERSQVVVVRRDQQLKQSVAFDHAPEMVIQMLQEMQGALLLQARSRQRRGRVEDQARFALAIEAGGFVEVSWCQRAACELALCESTKATLRCMPMDEQDQLQAGVGGCIVCGQPHDCVQALFARSY